MKTLNKKMSKFIALFAVLTLNILVVCSTYGDNASSTRVAKAEYNPDELISLVETHAHDVSSARCSFAQHKIHPMFNRPLDFKGSISFKRPDMLRWEYTEPIPSVIIINKDKGKRCSGKDNVYRFDLTTDPVMSNFSTSLKNWLAGDYASLLKEFTVSRPDEWSILLEGDKKNGLTGNGFNILITFNPKTLTPSSLTITDSHEYGAEKTTITFDECVENIAVPETEFKECYP